jgi:hypothetical protein
MTFPSSSCSCHANCTTRGQLSVSVIGALKFFGSPVVSVSNIKNIAVKKLDYKIKSFKRQNWSLLKTKNLKNEYIISTKKQQ